MIFTLEQLESLTKWYNDPISFINDCVKIYDCQDGVKDFKLTPDQRDMVSSLHNKSKTIVVGNRQTGCTSTCLAYVLWCTIFKKDYSMMVLYSTSTMAMDAMYKFMDMYQVLPSWIKTDKLRVNNKYEKVFEQSNNKIFFKVASPSVGRGYSMNLVLIDSCEHVRQLEETLMCIIPSVAHTPDSRIALCATSDISYSPVLARIYLNAESNGWNTVPLER